jgi:hypothetical protein
MPRMMSTFETPSGPRHIRVYDGEVKDDSDFEEDLTDGEVSDGEEDASISEFSLERNIGILRASKIITIRTHPDDEHVLIIKTPTASKIPYKFLHPSIYSNMKDLGDMSKFAQLVDAPENWKELHAPLVVAGTAVRKIFDRLRSLPDDAPESSISQEFSALITCMSVTLAVDVVPRAETKVIIGGLLALKEYDIRSQTDVHFLKNGINVIATEITTNQAFHQDEVWYRKSRGAQLLTAMYAHNAPTFIFTQKHWKLFVQNRNRNCALTFPFDNVIGASPRLNSILMKPMGPTFLEAITICLLSSLDSDPIDAARLESASEAIPFASPEQTRPKHLNKPQDSLHKSSKAARRSEEDGPSSSTRGGCDASRFKVGCRGGTDVYSYIRVAPADVVQRIEEQISAEETDIRRACHEDALQP